MGGPVIPWLAAAALAQDPPPDPAPQYEIVVWGQLAIDRARDAVIRQMEALGWELRDERGDELVFSPPSAWMGRATLHGDGSFTFGRPVIGFTPMPAEVWADEQLDEPELRQPEITVGAGPSFWILPSRRKLEPTREAVITATRDEVEHLRAVVRRTATEERLQALPARLDLLWSEGAPLEPGDPVLETPEQRRRAVLEYWATRADTPEGGRVAGAVEVWLAQVVQDSPHPITDAERAEFRRDDGHVLPE